MSKPSPFVMVQKGNFNNIERLFHKDLHALLLKRLEPYGQMGVDALSAATPVRTGKTAASWHYEVVDQGETVTIRWFNDNMTKDGDAVVVLLVRGHGTKNGHYVRGHDFVTPAIKPVFEEIASKAWAEVVK